MVCPGALHVPGLGPLLRVGVVGEDVGVGAVSVLPAYHDQFPHTSGPVIVLTCHDHGVPEVGAAEVGHGHRQLAHLPPLPILKDLSAGGVALSCHAPGNNKQLDR